MSPSELRHIKSRTGCQPCKRRHLKCDERKPTCGRCRKRGETCTGNFKSAIWHIENPSLYMLRPVLPPATIGSPQSSSTSLRSLGTLNYAPVNDIIQHWFDHACLTMAIVPPPMNPLSYPISPYLQRSQAVRHAVECVSQAHRNHFSAAQVAKVLEERSLALVSLQHEIGKASPSASPFRLRAILLASLLLGISSGWVTADEYGVEFLVGARRVVQSILGEPVDESAEDTCLNYLLGLYLYWEAVCSFLDTDLYGVSPSTISIPHLLEMVASRYLNREVHPVTGIATSLFPIITEIGNLYRRTVNFPYIDPCEETRIEAKLREWSPPGPPSDSLNARWRYFQSLSQSYHAMGVIMLHQARSVVRDLTEQEMSALTDAVGIVMVTLKVCPLADPLLNSIAPLLVIAGSELRNNQTELRALVSQRAREITKYTRITAYTGALELVRDIWRQRDNGSGITWLELMFQQRKILLLV